MNARERFLATLNFEKVDRPFRWETPAVWPATIKRWHKEGLPQDIDCNNITNSRIYAYFEMDRLEWLPFGSWITEPYYPEFEYRVLREEGENIVIRDVDGIIKKIKKVDADTSMPQFLEFPVKTRKDYYDNILPRWDISSNERFPNDWDDYAAKRADRDYPIGMFLIGPFGHLRNLLGDENLMYLFYDDPEFVHVIMEKWRSFYCDFIGMVTKDVTPDFIMIWEDMCFKNGPLISPDMYRQFISPYLKEVIQEAKKQRIKGICVDNDGNCTKMLPIYLECGANAFYPFEVQAGMDIVDVRKHFGNQFLILGGLEKKALSENKEAIRREVDEKVPFMLEQGGYIPMTDHSIPTNVSLEHFAYFVQYLRSFK
jgi:uroporphyrinogen decarboxylase